MAKRSPFYDRLRVAGAVCKDVSGWEVADWFGATDENVPEGLARSEDPPVYSFGRPYFFENWRREHVACREGVVLIDMSFMSKFLVVGRDAGPALNRLCTANIDGPNDTITYTQCLNDDGKMEADITVCKVTSERFIVIATDTMHRHVETLLRRKLDPTATKHVMVVDVTGAYAQLNIQGPQSRDLLARLTDSDVSNVGFPFRTAREIGIGYSRVLCARITYVGELGYELHIPCEHALDVYDRVISAGREVGLVHAGLKALSSLRMEKAYRDFGHDMDNMDSLLEVGLGFTADTSKADGFVGDHHVVAQKLVLKNTKGLRRRLVQVLLKDSQQMMFHGEVVWRDGERVGDIRAASYGHTLGGAVGLCMVEAHGQDERASSMVINNDYINSGKWEVEIGNDRYPATVSLAPMYDPKNARIKI